MKELPNTRFALVLRTDFLDDSAWESVCAAVQEPSTEFKVSIANMYFFEFADNVNPDGILRGFSKT